MAIADMTDINGRSVAILVRVVRMRRDAIEEDAWSSLGGDAPRPLFGSWATNYSTIHAHRLHLSILNDIRIERSHSVDSCDCPSPDAL
jgi:hypothetical protein